MASEGKGSATITIEREKLGGFGAFPENILLISIGGGKYACNCGHSIPDKMPVDGLACFPTQEDATIYMSLPAGLSGETVPKTFNEAREIAKSKPHLNCLMLFVEGKIRALHWLK